MAAEFAFPPFHRHQSRRQTYHAAINNTTKILLRWHSDQFPNQGQWVTRMLILTRKIGEIIHIGDNIRVIVKAVSGKTVRLGVMAPSEVPIYREELLKLPHETNENFGTPAPEHTEPASTSHTATIHHLRNHHLAHLTNRPKTQAIHSPPEPEFAAEPTATGPPRSHHTPSPSHSLLLALSAKD